MSENTGHKKARNTQRQIYTRSRITPSGTELHWRLRHPTLTARVTEPPLSGCKGRECEQHSIAPRWKYGDFDPSIPPPFEVRHSFLTRGHSP